MLINWQTSDGKVAFPIAQSISESREVWRIAHKISIAGTKYGGKSIGL
jgi:hypothetical protein